MNNKDIFKEVAEKFHTTPDLVKDEIQKAIDEASNSKDPKVRRFWKNIPKSGDKLTPEEAIEFIAYDIMRRRHLS